MDRLVDDLDHILLDHILLDHILNVLVQDHIAQFNKKKKRA